MARGRSCEDRSVWTDTKRNIASLNPPRIYPTPVFYHESDCEIRPGFRSRFVLLTRV